MSDTTNSTTQSIADYLSQLLKDRKQLAAFPNVFIHVERLLDEGNYFLIFYLLKKKKKKQENLESTIPIIRACEKKKQLFRSYKFSIIIYAYKITAFFRNRKVI